MRYYHWPSLDADFGTVRSGLEPSAEIGMRGFYRHQPPNPLFRADHPGAPPLAVDSGQVEASLKDHLGPRTGGRDLQNGIVLTYAQGLVNSAYIEFTRKVNDWRRPP